MAFVAREAKAAAGQGCAGCVRRRGGLSPFNRHSNELLSAMWRISTSRATRLGRRRRGLGAAFLDRDRLDPASVNRIEQGRMARLGCRVIASRRPVSVSPPMPLVLFRGCRFPRKIIDQNALKPEDRGDVRQSKRIITQTKEPTHQFCE